MNVHREIQAGPLVAAAGAVLLLVALFLDWYDEFSAWTIFELVDLLLAALALAAIASALSGLGFPRWVPARALPAVGAVAFVLVASQLLNHPPAGTDRQLEMGAWLGFAGSIAMLVGGLVSVARVSFAVNVSERPVPPAEPDVPPPAPPGSDDETQPLP